MTKLNDEDEWETLYRALCAVCEKYGKEDPFGNGDYWVVDDCWGGVTQKLIVSSTRFLTPALIADISNCISEAGLLGASVIVALDFSSRGIKLPPMGLIVDSQGATEEWDLDLIRSRVGNEFFRGPGQVLLFKPREK